MYRAIYIPLQGWKAQVYSDYSGHYVDINICPVFSNPLSAIQWARENWENM